jgi:hypothetical protein
MRNSTLLLIFANLSLLLTACTENEKVDLYAKSPMYKNAYKDGCTTAKGTYTKNHYAFNNSKIYYDGWFAGRHDCRQ